MNSFNPKDLVHYLQQNYQENLPEYLKEIEARAREQHVAIISREARALLSVLLQINRPKRILEVGTGSGFSALWFAWNCGPETRITTIELIEHRARAAEINFKKYDRKNQIELIRGDARTLLLEFTGEFDLIFLDAAKRYYPVFLSPCLRLLNENGLLIADDVLFEGLVFQKELPHRRRTMGRGLKEYLKEVLNHPELKTFLVPWDHGMAVSVKCKKGGNHHANT